MDFLVWAFHADLSRAKSSVEKTLRSPRVCKGSVGHEVYLETEGSRMTNYFLQVASQERLPAGQ